MADIFPSQPVLQRMADRMNANPDQYRRLGIVDCRVGINATDTGEALTVVFETYGCTGVDDGVAGADFVLEADSDVWQAMYDDIVAHGGASLDQTLNYLALPGINMRVSGSDQLAEDLFYRYNQTFQSFFDGAGEEEAELAGTGAVR